MVREQTWVIGDKLAVKDAYTTRETKQGARGQATRVEASEQNWLGGGLKIKTDGKNESRKEQRQKKDCHIRTDEMERTDWAIETSGCILES